MKDLKDPESLVEDVVEAPAMETPEDVKEDLQEPVEELVEEPVEEPVAPEVDPLEVAKQEIEALRAQLKAIDDEKLAIEAKSAVEPFNLPEELKSKLANMYVMDRSAFNIISEILSFQASLIPEVPEPAPDKTAGDLKIEFSAAKHGKGERVDSNDDIAFRAWDLVKNEGITFTQAMAKLKA